MLLPGKRQAMQNADIARRIHQQGGISETQAATMLDWILGFLKSTFQEDKSITISGLGKLIVRSKHARQGRIPQTGEVVMIWARRVVSFRPSLILKAEVNSTLADRQEAGTLLPVGKG
jgi:integration host factor subunit alpha